MRATTTKALFSGEEALLRLSIRVKPAAAWAAEAHSYETGGGVLEMDVTPLPPALHSYAHGGMMGLACSILGDETWSGILRAEDPTAWAALTQAQLALKLRGHGDAPAAAQGKLMMTLENSPILCAFGLVRTGCTAFFEGETTAAAENPAPKQQQQQQQPVPQALQAPGGQEMAVDGLALPMEPTKALLRYQEAMARANGYSYKPLAMEWDLW